MKLCFHLRDAPNSAGSALPFAPALSQIGRLAASFTDQRALNCLGLFGFADEAIAFVEIDEIGGGGAIGFGAFDAAVEDVGVFCIVRNGGIRFGDAEEIAKFGEEQLVIGAFPSAGRGPALNELFNLRHSGGILADSVRRSEEKNQPLSVEF
jgi:hypothetical protein